MLLFLCHGRRCNGICCGHHPASDVTVEGPLAQLAEQVTLNHLVPGSSPGGVTRQQQIEQRPDKEFPGVSLLETAGLTTIGYEPASTRFIPV